MSAAAVVKWPTELGNPDDGVHPWWCRRLDCAGGHRSATYAVGPKTVRATATAAWHTTVLVDGDGPLTDVQGQRLQLLRRILSDPAGSGR